MDRQHADLLMAEFGAQVGLPGLALDDDGACRLSFDDGAMTVDIRFDFDSGTASFAAPLDRVPPTPARLKRALAANFCWQDCAGAVFGLDRLANRLVLRRHCRLEDIDLSGLTAAVQRIVSHALAFTRMLGELEAGERPVAGDAERRPLAAALRA
jgi:hypothetical protein